MSLERFESMGREVAARESGRGAGREAARSLAEALRAAGAAALERFAAAAASGGAAHLDPVRVSPVTPDDRSIRAFQFTLQRGRWRAVVVSKDRGEVMLVGPFKRGREESPCHAVRAQPGDPDRTQLDAAFEALLVAFLEQAYAS